MSTPIEDMETLAEDILSITRDIRRMYKKQREDKPTDLNKLEAYLLEKIDRLKRLAVN